MRILWLSPYLPAPLSGAGTRVYNLLKVLATSCDIDLIAGTFTGPPAYEILDELRSLCRSVQLIPPAVSNRRYKRLLQVKSLIDRKPAHFRIFYSPEMQARIDSMLSQSSYDVVVLEHSFMGYYSLRAGIPVVLDQHNVESEIFLRSAQRERSFVRRAFNLIEYRKYRTDEGYTCRSVNLILAVSSRDCETMQGWAGTPRCVVVPNGVDTSYFVPLADGDGIGEAPSILFTGTMDYSPNAEAMLYFASAIWPLIHRRLPEVTLDIVGRSPPPEITKLAKLPGIHVRGAVPDVRPWLARARVVVAPLRVGGGTRLKILEAMAMARPVVSTSVGCEGLQVKDERHLLVADDPAKFAAAVVDLLRDPERCTALGQEGRRLVEERYDWCVLGRHMEDALHDLVSAHQQIHA